jgi:hypothetical protein
LTITVNPPQPSATAIDPQPQTKPDEQQSENPGTQKTPKRLRNVIFKAYYLLISFIFFLPCMRDIKAWS